MSTTTMKAPAGVSGQVTGPAGTVTIGADGTAAVDSGLVDTLLKAGWTFAWTENRYAYFQAPITQELVSIVAAATPTSATPMTLASQPGSPRKLQVRCVQSGAVAGLVINIVGVDARGNVVSESVNVAGASSATFITANGYAHVTSVTPVGTVTNVTTIGVGVGSALALPGPASMFDLVVNKVSAGIADDVVSTATIDTVANTIQPTSIPNATLNFHVWYSCGMMGR